MRFNRLIAAIGVLALLAACGEREAEGEASAPTPETFAPAPVDVAASDELPGLAGAPAGIAFWTHSNVAFNSLMIVAGADGLVSYNMEDGAEVSRAPGLSLEGVAVSYLGFGADAAGLVASFDPAASAFRFYGIDNASRLFIPLAGGPSMRGAVRGFCLGRATQIAEPTLFVLQKGELRIFNLANNADGKGAEIAVASDAVVPVPDAIKTCAVDVDGVVLLAGSDGALYRLEGAQSFASPFAKGAAGEADEIAVLASPPDESGAMRGQIAALDRETGVISLYDREDGHALGAARIAATDDIEAVASATAMGASAANLGGLYRDGAIALGVDDDAPSIRLAPANGVANALSLDPLAPANPRGTKPVAPETGSLIIDTPVLPGGE